METTPNIWPINNSVPNLTITEFPAACRIEEQMQQATTIWTSKLKSRMSDPRETGQLWTPTKIQKVNWPGNEIWILEIENKSILTKMKTQSRTRASSRTSCRGVPGSKSKWLRLWTQPRAHGSRFMGFTRCQSHMFHHFWKTKNHQIYHLARWEIRFTT